MSNLGKTFKLPIGFRPFGSDYTRKVVLLDSNSISEEVFTKKLAQEPFTWIANVISVAVDTIGDTPVGEAVRTDYVKSSKVNIPTIVKQIPLSDANSMLLEIHRRAWESEVKDMETVCKFCTKSILIDVDLNKIELSEKDLETIQGDPEFEGITCDLEEFNLDSLLEKLRMEEASSLKGTGFNRLVFRIPTLGDALKNQDYFDKSIEMWRRIGADCLVAIQRIEKDAEGRDSIVSDMPEAHVKFLAIKIYNVLTAGNLKSIRHSLREELPVMPFAYMEVCPCDATKKIPYALDSTGFFSE